MAEHGEADDRPRKIARVKQNHKVIITAINSTTMDHFCKIILSPDRMNPDGTVKNGIKINLSEFSKGVQVLGERCNYRLLTPLSSHAYMAYLNKATEDYLENREVDGPGERPIVEVFNHTPFSIKNRNFTALNGKQVFEIFNIDKIEKGFAQEVDPKDLPFIVNWASGAQAKPMQVDDDALMTALVEMLHCFDELQPKITGLGLCALTEFGRILLYNILVDGDREGPPGESDEDDEQTQNDINFRGYKQMILILNSQEVETGKLFLAEILLRIYHGRKTGLHSTISFDSSKELLKKGEPIVIDDFNNDEVGAKLLSRCSKAIWGQATVTLRNKAIVPRSNLVICSNEQIRDLKVDGKNRDEVFRKFSIINLGEEPLSNSENKEENFKRILELTKVIRKHIPSFFGFMLQACGKYISREEFQLYAEVTKHERLGNILKNVKNVYNSLREFCDKKDIEKPKSLEELDVSSLIQKSELVIKFKTPDQVAEVLISHKIKFVQTEHNNIEGIAFSYKLLSKYPWLRETMNFEKDGIPCFTKMRSRKLYGEAGAGRRVVFMRFDFLKQSTVEKLQEVSNIQDIQEKSDPKVLVATFFDKECKQIETARKKIQDIAINFVFKKCQDQNNNDKSSNNFVCEFCQFLAKSKTGLKNHKNRCKNMIPKE